VLKLYRKQFGVLPVATEWGSLDSMSALSQDRKTLTVAVVNPSLKAVEIELAVKGARLAGNATRWQIAGNNPQAFNEPGKPAAVGIDVAAIQDVAKKLSVAPCSVTLFALPMK
jgi:alpha-N-arabinofuranosidase